MILCCLYHLKNINYNNIVKSEFKKNIGNLKNILILIHNNLEY